MAHDTDTGISDTNEHPPASGAVLNWSARRINKLAAGLGATRYVEIGVNKGVTFHAVAIAQRTAVDPKFALNPIEFQDANTQFFEVTSDDYFQRLASDVAPDIYFLDGLHTFEQTLRDFNNCVVHSHSRTVWLIDDTHPVDVYSTLTNSKRTMLFRHETGNKGLAWHGDVFKLVCYIHDFIPTLSYRTLVGTGNGQTLVWRANTNRRIPRFNNLETISRLSYFDFRDNRDIFSECAEDEAVQTCISEVTGRTVFGPTLRGATAVGSAPAKLQASRTTGYPSRIVSRSDVYVEPYFFEPGKANKPNRFCGGIEAAKTNRFARMACPSGYRDRPPPRGPVAVQSVPGQSLFGGPVWGHFGHILTESIHRLWPLIGAHYDRAVFTGVIGLRGVLSAEDLWKAEVPSTVKAVMEAMGLPDIETFLVREPTVFEGLDIPQPGSRYQNGVEAFYFDYLRTYQDRIAKRLPGYTGPQSVYYSRRHILAQGGIVGSTYFEEVMARAGIVSVIPESLTLDEQLNHLLNARRIVFDQGSSVHLTELFAHLPGTFYMLARRPGDNIFCAAFRDRAQFFNLVNDDNVGLLANKYGAINTPAAVAFYKRPEDVFAALARHGLVEGRFDRARYMECEAADLARVPFQNEEINAARWAELGKYRNTVMA